MAKKTSVLYSFFLIFLCVFFFDRISKTFLQKELASRGSLPVVPGIFHLTLVHNTGAAFGLFKGGTLFFVGVTFLCLSSMVLLLNNNTFIKKIMPLDNRDPLIRFALSLIAGGACGNLYDRLKFSYVVDFLDFRIWPVFNIADSAITIGGLLLFYSFLKHRNA